MIGISLIFSLIFSTYVLASEASYYPCSKQSSQRGEPIQIISFSYDEIEKKNKFEFNKTALGSILLSPEIADKELVILNIAGVLRSGKSFFLNLLLQYLENNEALRHDTLDIKRGFSFRGGYKPDTLGMLMWSQPFCAMTNTGKEVAILLIDTQGAFDLQQTFADSSFIFALSFLTSSIQIYNLKAQINANDLQNLELFVTYGNQVTGESEFDGKPFQNLIFLVRDWPFPQDFFYGQSGGQLYLDDVMTFKENEPDSINQLKSEIKVHFTKLDCFLMPYPGDKVVYGRFNASDIVPEFLNKFNEFAQMVFNPENLVLKQIAGKNVTGKVMTQTFELYVNYFKDKTHLRPKTVKEAFCEVHNSILFSDVKIFYNSEMAKVCTDQLKSSDPNQLKLYYSDIRNRTINMFVKEIKSGCQKSHEQYLRNLTAFIDRQFEICYLANQEKIIKELESSTNELKIELIRIKKEHLNTKQLLRQSNEEHENTRNLLRDRETRLSATSRELSHSEEQVETLKDQFGKCDNERQNIKKISTVQVIQIAELNYMKQTCDRLLNKSESSAQNLKDQLLNIKNEFSNLQQQLYNKTAQFDATSEKLNDTLKKRNNLEEKVKICDKEHQNTKNRLSDKEAQLRLTNEMLTYSKNQVDKLLVQANNCIKEHQITKNSLSKKEAETYKTNEKLKYCNNERQIVENSLKNERNELSDIRSTLESMKYSNEHCEGRLGCVKGTAWVPFLSYAC